jgi:hypothetical protein
MKQISHESLYQGKKKMTRSKQPSGQMTLEQKSSVATLSQKSNPKQNRWEGEPFYRPKSPNTPEINQYCKRSKKKKTLFNGPPL